MTAPPRCSACGQPIRKGRVLQAKVWDDEGVSAQVCSVECQKAYSLGVVRGDSTTLSSGRPAIIAVVILCVVALVELGRGILVFWWNDPLAMVVPLWVHGASALILGYLAFLLARGRRAAYLSTIIITSLTAVAHISIAAATSNPYPLLLVLSLACPMMLLLIGEAGITRQAFAIASAGALPVFVLVSLGSQAVDHLRALERIEEVSLPGSVVTSGPSGLQLRLAEGWRALQPNNGIVDDWPHSEFQLIHTSSGAPAIAVSNPDCDRRALAEFQQRALDALAQNGGDPVPIGLVRLSEDMVELRIQIRRGRYQFRTFNLFRELPRRAEVRAEERPGCFWLHCFSHPRYESRVRSDCRAMAESVERLSAESE